MFAVPALPGAVGTLHVVPAGEMLRQRNDAVSDSVLYLDSGRVVMGVMEEGSIRHQTAIVQAPAWLDAPFALAQQPCAVDMVADVRCCIHRVPVADFVHSMKDWPAPAHALLREMAQSYCQQAEMTVSRLVQSAEARCAQWLLRHAQQSGDGGDALQVTLRQRKRTIAAQLGIAPETFSRILRQLREHGLIAGRGNVFSLPRPGVLRRMALPGALATA